MDMRYFITCFSNAQTTVPFCDPNGYHNLPMAQLLAIEISRGCLQVCVEHRYKNEVMFAELYENGVKTSN